MPNLANAKKALRQNVKHAARNKEVRDEIASLRRHFRMAVKSKKIDEAKKSAVTLQQKLDKAVRANIMKKNTVSRIKSRMAKAINSAVAAK